MATADDSPAPPPSSLGEMRLGSYRLLEQLGSGGMSSVFRAIHEESGLEVALKVLPRYLAKNPTLLQRFLREARNAEALQHPGIVAIYDQGLDGGRHYLALEYVPGTDLHDRVRDGGPLAPAEALRVVQRAAEALRYAAGQGVIHRDVKPANLLMAPDGTVKIIDLGLALQADAEDERVTRDGTTVGTVDYMAPEQARDSRAASVRSDVYSLGCAFYFLLTGQPPFPGGDIVDKLRRHARAPAPNPRALNPAVPEGLVRVIQRMLEKDPANRPHDYDALLELLGAASLEPPTAAGDTALFDDDEPLAVGDTALFDDDDGSAAGGDTALFDDDEPTTSADFAIGPPARPAAVAPPPTIEAQARRSSSEQRLVGDELPLAELAALDDDDDPVPTRRGGARTAARPPAVAIDPFADLGGSLAGRAARSAPTADDLSIRDWVVRGGMIGLVVALVGFGLVVLIRMQAESPTVDDSEVVEIGEPAPEPAIAPAPAGPRPPVAKAAPSPAVPAPDRPGPTASPAVALVEPTYPAEVEARFGPPAAAFAPPMVEGEPAIVRRLGGVSLRSAIDGRSQVVEIADDGPFFEDDLRLGERTRAIRAAPGHRPILVVQSRDGGSAAGRARPALIDVESRHLVIEGIDLVIAVDELPEPVKSVFRCAGGSLVLRDCSVTIVGGTGREFGLVAVEPPARSLVRLERCLIRGTAGPALAIGAAPALIDLDRTALIGGRGPIFDLDAPAGGGGGGRQLFVRRSLLAGRGPLLAIEPASAALDEPPPTVRLLGSTIAYVPGDAGSVMLATPGAAVGASAPGTLIDWQGRDNRYEGWREWLPQGWGGRSVAGLEDARSSWTGTDPDSRETSGASAVTSPPERLGLEALAAIAPDLAATLDRIAWPRPYLMEKTLAAFDLPDLPATIAADRGWAAPAPPPTDSSAARPEDRPGGEAVPLAIPRGRTAGAPVARPTATLPAPSADGTVTFDTAVAPWSGDLGLFLAELVRSGSRSLRVAVRGVGAHPWTPIQLPAGISVAIRVEPSSRSGLSWTARAPAGAPAWIAADGGSLRLEGLRIRGDAAAPAAFAAVDGGDLTLVDCGVFVQGRNPAPAGAALVAFRSVGDQPRLCRLVDCVLVSDGDALRAEVGRGTVALTNCALAARRSAIALVPVAVAPEPFQADLRLDRCTLAAEAEFVAIADWPAAGPGPDRPWVIVTSRCAFLDAFVGRTRTAALLRSRGRAIERGLVAWQADRDAYDIGLFLSGDQAPSPLPRADYRPQWERLWGRSHVVEVAGPTAGRREPAARFADDRLAPGRIAPANLVLATPTRTVPPEIGADLRRLGLAPAADDRPAGRR